MEKIVVRIVIEGTVAVWPEDVEPLKQASLMHVMNVLMEAGSNIETQVLKTTKSKIEKQEAQHGGDKGAKKNPDR